MTMIEDRFGRWIELRQKVLNTSKGIKKSGEKNLSVSIALGKDDVYAAISLRWH